ncbi:DUF2955 domain-containing protein [Thalassotalea euphylliae]|uniref:DUF2955 domain-containing protein n=1 Tax=Thalassotalea euphylliae TaxID=1655234 RepID=UPI00363BE871
MSIYDACAIRFTIGTVIAVALAFTVAWDFSFLLPILVTKFLGNTKPSLPLKLALAIVVIIVMAFFTGIVVTKLFLPYPVVFILVMTVLIFWLCYWNQSGGNELAVLMTLIALIVIPMLTIVHDELAKSFINGFLFSCVGSVFIAFVMYQLIPDPQNRELPLKAKIALAPKVVRARMAALSTLIVLPALCFFFFFDLNSSMIILMFIAILALSPDVTSGIKGSAGILLGNTLGGVIAICLYLLLIAVPKVEFLVLMSALLTMSLAHYICTEHKLAPLAGMALTTVFILIATASLSESDVDTKFYTRIIQLAIACGYIVIATIIYHPLLQKIKFS